MLNQGELHFRMYGLSTNVFIWRKMCVKTTQILLEPSLRLVLGGPSTSANQDCWTERIFLSQIADAVNRFIPVWYRKMLDFVWSLRQSCNVSNHCHTSVRQVLWVVIWRIPASRYMPNIAFQIWSRRTIIALAQNLSMAWSRLCKVSISVWNQHIFTIKYCCFQNQVRNRESGVRDAGPRRSLLISPSPRPAIA